MTERLTETYPCNKCKVEFCSRLCYRMTRWAEIAKEKLAEYETAEAEGRLVVLPRCNIEDTVYIPVDFQNRIYTGNVKGYEYYTLIKKWVVKIRTNDRQTCYETFENFGKTFFLTREEAEKALKEMKIENGSD